MAISSDTRVFITGSHAGVTYWLRSAENQRDKTGRLILQGQWSTTPSEAKPVTLELATVYRRRFAEETNTEVHFTLNAATSAEFVEELNESNQGEDTRKPKMHRGLLARPGVNARTAVRAWYVRIADGPSQMESIWSGLPETAIDRVFEMGLQDKAEKIPEQQASKQEVEQRPAGPRIRPGDLRR